MNALVYSSSLAAAFLGGVLALFAPCCIVSLLPAYLAAALRRGSWQLVGMTLRFAAGVSVVLLPVVLGIGALSQVLGASHREVYFVVGLFLVLLGVFSLTGHDLLLPIPMVRAPKGMDRGDAGGVFLLGIVSGFASSCCAPVLIGVLALTALAPSLVNAVGLGLAYVFGMVLPLLLAAILWERLGLDRASIARLGTRRLVIRDWSAKVTDLVGGVLFLVMGTLALFIAFSGQSTYTPDFLLTFNRQAIAVGADAAQALGMIPPILQGITLLVIAGLVGWLAWRRPGERGDAPNDDRDPGLRSVADERLHEEAPHIY